MFSPDGRRIAGRDGQLLQCWEVETGKLLAETEVVSSGDLLGWLSGSRRICVGTSQYGRISVWDVESHELVEMTNIEGPAYGQVRADQLHVRRVNALQSWNSDLQLESTLVFDAHEDKPQLLRVSAKGDILATVAAMSPWAVVLTEHGQQCLSVSDFTERYGWHASPGDEKKRVDD